LEGERKCIHTMYGDVCNPTNIKVVYTPAYGWCELRNTDF
jgi:hypothetical protein